ncbi:arylesterase [Lacibacterium aquatile]|uniref:Arylesterase n=1 Tax=Lacibacterium aquatile TaxID=1168082 RepID=A0ABW5DKU0_9PROT
MNMPSLDLSAVTEEKWGRRRLLGSLLALGFMQLLPSPLKAQGAKRLLILGDSLAAGYGLPTNKGFVVRLEAALKAAGEDVTVLNGGVSGDTSAGARDRLDWALADQPTHVIVEIGANDGLRGLEPKQMEANIDQILTKLKAAKLPTLLAGMLAPPNLGKDYAAAFNSAFPRLAEKHAVPLYPFFLDGVAAERSLNQPDGIHPNEAGVEEVVRRILPAVRQLLSQG